MERSLLFLILSLSCIYLIFDDLFGKRRVSSAVALLGLPEFPDINPWDNEPDPPTSMPATPVIPGGVQLPPTREET